MKKTSLQLRPYQNSSILQPMEAFGAQIWIRADTDQTGGAFNLFEILLPAEFETPLHIHYAEDVALHVLEGALDIFWGTEEIQAQAGSFFFQPRGTPHGLRARGTKTVRLTYMTIPAGLDRFVIAHGRSVMGLDLLSALGQFKVEVLGPLPE
jgi:mannose-6-phosphate isomerase-like protein (cupin superfamily)